VSIAIAMFRQTSLKKMVRFGFQKPVQNTAIMNVWLKLIQNFIKNKSTIKEGQIPIG
jgi:hypothetical protein